jgi:MoxR-like ATPase
VALLQDEATRDSAHPKSSQQVITPSELKRWQGEVAKVLVAEKVQRYLVSIASALRSHKEVRNGLSPRGLIMLQRVSQAFALLQQRDFVTPDDIQQVAKPVLRVRLSGNFDIADPIVEEVLASVSVPT